MATWTRTPGVIDRLDETPPPFTKPKVRPKQAGICPSPGPLSKNGVGQKPTCSVALTATNRHAQHKSSLANLGAPLREQMRGRLNSLHLRPSQFWPPRNHTSSGSSKSANSQSTFRTAQTAPFRISNAIAHFHSASRILPDPGSPSHVPLSPRRVDAGSPKRHLKSGSVSWDNLPSARPTVMRGCCVPLSAE